MRPDRASSPGLLRPSAHLDHLADDTDGDLLGRVRADVEADGRVDSVEAGTVATTGLDPIPEHELLALAAEHTDVTCRRADGVLDDDLVVLMPTGSSHDVGLRVDRDPLEDSIDIGGDTLIDIGMPFGIGEIRPVVGDDDVKAGVVGKLGDLSTHMATTEDVEQRRRGEGFDEYLAGGRAAGRVQVRSLLRQAGLRPAEGFGVEGRTEAAPARALGSEQGSSSTTEFGRQDAGDALSSRLRDIGVDFGCLGVDSLTVDADGAAAVETMLTGLLFRHRVRRGLRPAAVHHVTGDGEDLGLQTTAPDRTQHAAVGPHQHLGAVAHRDRAAALHHGRQHSGPSGTSQGCYSCDDVVHHRPARSTSRA
jgi:hypothetical protein